MKLLFLLALSAISYGAQLPTKQPRPLPSPTAAVGTAVLPQELLDQFKSLIDAMDTSAIPQVQQIKKELTDLYQQVAQKKIYLTALAAKLKELIAKMSTDLNYKDKKFTSPIYGEIALSQFAATFEDLVKNIEKVISLFAFTPQKINYLREIINALPSGKNIPEKINIRRVKLMQLLDEARNKKISLDELVAELYQVKESFEKETDIKDWEFQTTSYGKLKLKDFATIILGDLIEQIGKKEPLKVQPSRGIFPELEDPQFLQPTIPASATPTAGPHGLSNIGNSCFMNASLQSLYTLNELNTNLINRIGTHYYPSDTFGAEYIKLIQLMRTPSTGIIEPKAVCHRGWKKMGFNPLTQQDNDEFIITLLDELLGNPNDPLRKLLEIQTRTYLKNEPHQESSHLLLSLSANCPTLDQCLKDYFAIEKVEWGKPIELVDKQEKLVKTGKYLIVHLKRNTWDREKQVLSKLADPISFPMTNLNLNPYASPGVKLPLYRLNAIVIHAGSARGGHYTAYVRYDDRWYFVNDSEVTQVSPQLIQQIAQRGYGSAPDQTPTTLFYEAI